MNVLSLAAHLLQEVDELVVQRTVWHKLQSTNRVSNALEEVALSVSEVVHGVSVPLCSGAVVWCMDDAIDDRIAEVHVRVGHVELGAQHHTALNSLRSVHLVKQFEVLLNWTVAVGRVGSGSSRSALLLCNLLSSLLIDVCVSVLDHPDGKLPQLVEVVGSVVYVAPLESEP